MYERIFPAEVILLYRFSHYIFQIQDDILHLYIANDDARTQKLVEAKLRGKVPLGGQYSATEHSAHTPPPTGQEHIHVYAKNNQIFALNVDGTAHDQSHQIRIPGEVAKAINRIFPDWVIPPRNLIEFINLSAIEGPKQRLHG